MTFSALSGARQVDHTEQAPHRLAALLLLIQFACMWGAFFILMPAINWPASLDVAPSVILPLILEQAGPVFTGYAAYLRPVLRLRG